MELDILFIAVLAGILLISEWRDRVRARERQRAMLYEGMTVDEAEAVVWTYEEMTEEERSALPVERRVEVRKIREDLAKHKKVWGLE